MKQAAALMTILVLQPVMLLIAEEPQNPKPTPYAIVYELPEHKRSKIPSPSPAGANDRGIRDDGTEQPVPGPGENPSRSNFSDLSLVANTSAWPWSPTVKLFTKWVPDLLCTDPVGCGSVCSGVMIDPFHVLTAAHCVYNDDDWNGQPVEVAVVPSYDDGSAPFGFADATSMLVWEGWVDDLNFNDHDSDIAVLRLDWPIGSLSGYHRLGFYPDPPQGEAPCDPETVFVPFSCVDPRYYEDGFLNPGYPAEDPFDGQLMLYRSGAFEYPNTTIKRLGFDRFSWGGQSGSPFFKFDGSDYVVHAVLTRIEFEILIEGWHTWAVRVDSEKFGTFDAWIQEHTPASPSLYTVAVIPSSTAFEQGETVPQIDVKFHNYSSTTVNGPVTIQAILFRDPSASIPEHTLGDARFFNDIGPKETVALRTDSGDDLRISCETTVGTHYLGAQIEGFENHPGTSLARVTVSPDATAPSVECPGVATAECSSLGGVDRDDPQLQDFLTGVRAQDACGFSLSSNEPDLLPVGTTNVDFRATDPTGNSAACTSEIIVTDTTLPELTIPPDMKSECEDSTGVILDIGEATGSDVCCGDQVTIANNDPTLFPIGTTAVSWSATDCNGVVATDDQMVTVLDPMRYFSTASRQFVDGATRGHEAVHRVRKCQSHLEESLEPFIPSALGLDAVDWKSSTEILFSVARSGGVHHTGGFISLKKERLYSFDTSTGTISTVEDWSSLNTRFGNLVAVDQLKDQTIVFAVDSLRWVGASNGAIVVRPGNAYRFDPGSGRLELFFDGRTHLGLSALDGLDVLPTIDDGSSSRIAFSTPTNKFVLTPDGGMHLRHQNIYVYDHASGRTWLELDGREHNLGSLDALAMEVLDLRP